jgi:drug/metabolite transporter (DMT)-like permease
MSVDHGALPSPAPRPPPAGEPESAQRYLGVALAVAGLLLMSLESPGLRLTQVSPWDNAFWLGTFSALAMFAWVSVAGATSLRAAARVHTWATLTSGVLQSASTLFFVLAIHHTSIANTQVIFAATPAIGASSALLALRERPSLRTWLGIGGSMLGLSIAVSGSFVGGRIFGDLCALLAVCAYAANLTLWRRYPALDRQLAVGLGGMGMALCAALGADPTSVDSRTLLILALLGLVSAPIGRVLVARATRYLPVAQVSLLTPVETIAATTWGWLFLRESPPTTALIGGMIVITSLVFGLRRTA